MKIRKSWSILFLLVILVFSAVIIAPRQALADEIFFDSLEPQPKPGWTADPLWHPVKNSSCAVPGYSSATHAWYFGRGEPAGCNYDPGSKVRGELIYGEDPNYKIDVSGVSKVALNFRYFREVEFYEKGAYDKTYVEVSFYTKKIWGDWTRVWYKDSSDPSLATWRSSADDPKDPEKNITGEIIVPFGTTRMKIRFVFDSVDKVKNDYTGWLIDDVMVSSISSEAPTIIDTTLPEGKVGLLYNHKMSAEGGTPPYTWSIIGGALPLGLKIDANGDIYGIPSVVGSFNIEIQVTDFNGENSEKSYNLVITPAEASIFFDNLEPSPKSGWIAHGLWHLADNISCASPSYSSPTHAWYYGKDDTCSYDAGTRNSGELISPKIDLPSEIRALALSFQYLRQVEYWTGFGGPFDRTTVWIQFDGGDWKQVWSKDSRDPSASSWRSSGPIPISVPGGASTMRIKFTFDSVDGVANDSVGWLIDDVSITSPRTEVFKIEVGKVNVGTAWKTVYLNKTFVDPVVVAKPLSLNNDDPAVVRIRNVSPTSFEIRLQEWDYLDVQHPEETVSYIVMQKGHFGATETGGADVEAGTIYTGPDTHIGISHFKSISFSSDFANPPIVITSVTSFNEADPVVTRNRNVTNEGFEVTLQEQEVNPQEHAGEWISYIAWEFDPNTHPNIGMVDGIEYAMDTRDDITDGFTGGFITIDTPYLSVRLQVDEEQSLDDETNHNAEKVGYIAFKQLPLRLFMADMQTTNEEDTSNLRYTPEIFEAGEVSIDYRWETVEFDRPFVNVPIVLAKPLSLNDDAPAVVRIRNVTAYRFQIKVQEWDYLDGSHGYEKVAYMAIEPGYHILEDGTEVVAGTVDTNATGSFTPVDFEDQSKEQPPTVTLSTVPIVITSVMSFNDTSKPFVVVTRNRNVTKSGFEITMQEQEDSDQSHATETLAYIAWEPGAGKIGRWRYEVGATGNVVTDGTDDPPYQIIFIPDFFSALPFFLADMQTTDGEDPANLRWQDKTEDHVRVQVAEEKSKDDEVIHTTENVGFFAFECWTCSSSSSSAAETGAIGIAVKPVVEDIKAFPSSTRDIDTVTFMIEGQGVRDIRVEIYNLAGSQVFDSGFVANGFEWHLQNNNGHILANGVYLYTVTVRGAAGEILRSKVSKLVLLR